MDLHEQNSDHLFSVRFSFKGKSATVTKLSHRTTSAELLKLARNEFQVGDDVLLRLLFKGKIIGQELLESDDTAGSGSRCRDAFVDDFSNRCAFPEGVTIPKSGAKVIVIGTEAQGLRKLNSGRSDPTIRGFDETTRDAAYSARSTATLCTYWGPSHGSQHSQFKFCRMQECNDASFGSRPGATTPHAFEARRLLERLATDPGIVAILTSRELVVGTLGEMDPLDDRLMLKKRQDGACLLGYNTNHGMRIDVKLRTDDLSSFRPYSELAATLIHEISHNWVGEHNLIFWTNYGQMRVEYLWKHACLMLGGEFINGTRTAVLAGVMDMIMPHGGSSTQRLTTLKSSQIMENINQSVLKELSNEMAQHGIPLSMVAPAVLDFSKDLIFETKTNVENSIAGGQRLGTALSSDTDKNAGDVGTTARERALAAAEKRAKEAKKKSG